MAQTRILPTKSPSRSPRRAATPSGSSRASAARCTSATSSSTSSIRSPRPTPSGSREGEDFLKRFRAFLTERVDPQQIEDDAKIPDDVIEGLKDLGALGMKIPKEYGGLGLTQVYYNRRFDGRHLAQLDRDAALRPPVDRPARAAEDLRLRGAEAEWLPKVAKDHISAFLLTEPDVGSDPARMGATAVPSEDGSTYTINGTKLWATNGVIADVVVVMAVVPKTDDAKGGITAFICPTDLDGHQGRAPQRVHGPARHRELGDRRSRTSRSRPRTSSPASARASRSRSTRSTPAACRCPRSASARPSTR